MNSEVFANFCTRQMISMAIRKSTRADLSEGITAQLHTDGKSDYSFF